MLCALLFSFFTFHFSPFTSLSAQEHEHSAMTALKWSLIPGGGQVYNQQAWKIPIIYGAFAATGYFVYTNYQQMSMFKEEYLYRVNHNDQPSLANYASYPTSSILSYYNSYNQTYQLTIIIAVGIYALNLVDAYVFGHLFDFRIDDELSLDLAPALTPTPLGWQPTLGLRFSF